MNHINRKSFTVISIFLSFIIIIICILPLQNIMHTDPANTFASPSFSHPMGTDNLGRDVYSLMINGALRTIIVILISTAISFLAGCTLGIMAGYFKGGIAKAINFLADFTLIVPTFIIAMILSSIFGFSPVMAGLLFGIGNMGNYILQSKSLCVSVAAQEYITAEKVLGIPDMRILVFHILPNIYKQLFVFMGNQASTVIIQYAGLSFIGLGTDITKPDWGTLLYSYKSFMISHPLLVLYPALSISLLALIFHLVFDSFDKKKSEGLI